MLDQNALKIKVAWWVKPCLTCVAWTCYLTRATPDVDKINRVVLRGVKVIA